MNYLAATNITLDSNYEGTFDVQTKLAKAFVREVDEQKALVDPLAEGRKRGYQFDQKSSSRIFGWVGWGSRPGPTTQPNHQGHVDIVSSHSSVVLQLEGAGNELNSGRSWP
jgi:hypothetical protein